MIKQSLISRYQQVRQTTLDICSRIENEDFVVQPAPEVSPPKWHLGHTTWFFETVVLKQFKKNYTEFNHHYNVLFNSYYKAAGTHTIQSERGNLSRPTVAEVERYRAYVDSEIALLLSTLAQETKEIETLIETGIHHEQQHQELLHMDIKYILASNVEKPSYALIPLEDAAKQTTPAWSSFTEGLYEIGDDSKAFAYDNERPRHKQYLYSFAINQSLVTNGEFLAFIEDNGYTQAKYWLSQGWDWVTHSKIQHPLYWALIDGQWYEYTLHGLAVLDLSRPLVHISYFEADAFANWKNLRLPTEQELEVYLSTADAKPNHKLDAKYHPNDPLATEQAWCWTRSQYSPYPKFKAFDGILNEYNGKFMCNQFVLRGGCVVTPINHYRHSYRNFYLPEQRWMFSGIRLAKDVT